MTKWLAGENHDKMESEMEQMQLGLHMVTIEGLVPQEHFLRK